MPPSVARAAADNPGVAQRDDGYSRMESREREGGRDGEREEKTEKSIRGIFSCLSALTLESFRVIRFPALDRFPSVRGDSFEGLLTCTELFWPR